MVILKLSSSSSQTVTEFTNRSIRSLRKSSSSISPSLNWFNQKMTCSLSRYTIPFSSFRSSDSMTFLSFSNSTMRLTRVSGASPLSIALVMLARDNFVSCSLSRRTGIWVSVSTSLTLVVTAMVAISSIRSSVSRERASRATTPSMKSFFRFRLWQFLWRFFLP